MNFVNYVTTFDEDTPYNLIKEIKPDILVKGRDWEGKTVVGEDVVKQRGGKVQFIDLVSGVSTSSIIDRIVTKVTK